jgi:hypothetical protein
MTDIPPSEVQHSDTSQSVPERSFLGRAVKPAILFLVLSGTHAYLRVGHDFTWPALLNTMAKDLVVLLFFLPFVMYYRELRSAIRERRGNRP